MKTFACVLLMAALVAAEPPRFRQARYRFERQELGDGVEKEQTTERSDEGYPAAGYRPAVPFNLPTRQEAAPPSTSYGVPADSYGAPFNTYSAPETEYGIPEKESEEKAEKENEDDKEAEKKQNLEEAPNKDAEVISAQGAYYVLLPGSQLQRVQFQTENDIRNMAYTARLQYKNEDRAPLFVYNAVPQYQAAYVQLY